MLVFGRKKIVFLFLYFYIALVLGGIIVNGVILCG